jgi:hypothetical protein
MQNKFKPATGQRVNARETFTSMAQKEFSPNNFRRYLEQPSLQSKKDYSDYSKNLNEEMYDDKAQVIQKKTSPMMAQTICSKTSTNFFSTRKQVRRPRLSMTDTDFNPEEAELKPRLLETKVVK